MTICTLLPEKSPLFIFFRDFFLIFRERGREGERMVVGETLIGFLLPAPSWGPGPQLRHVPWLELKLQPYGLQAGTQFIEPQQPECCFFWCFFNSPPHFCSYYWSHIINTSFSSVVFFFFLFDVLTTWSTYINILLNYGYEERAY